MFIKLKPMKSHYSYAFKQKMAYSKNTDTDVEKRVIEVTYQTETLYEIPKDWKLEDVYVKYGNLYYKGVLQCDVKSVDLESDMKYPMSIEEHTDGLEYMFDED